MEIRRSNAQADVTLSEEDGLFRVLAGEELLVETAVESWALLTYEEALAERDPGKRKRDQERAHFDITSARWDGFGQRSVKNKGHGGKGGRGGV